MKFPRDTVRSIATGYQRDANKVLAGVTVWGDDASWNNPRTTKKENEMNATLKDEILKHNPVLFAFTAPAAKQVSLAGGFNNWDPHAMPMRKGTNGVWLLSVALEPGRYEYRFIADGVWQNDPTAKQRTDNFLGGENSVKTIAG